MSLAAKEYTPEELDALEAQAKQRPVYDQIAGGVGAAMAYYDGPQETKAEYTPEELDARDALYAQPELTPEELDQRLVNAKYDANTLLAPEQLKEADAVEKRLRDQGKQPGIVDTAFALGGGILQSVADWNMALDKGGNVKAAVKNALIKTGVINGDYERMPMVEAALQAPASAKAGIQGATLNAMETAIALNGLAKGKPRYRVKETGEFVFAPLGGVAPLTQLAGEGKTLVPVTDADLEEHRYQQYATENAIRKTYLDVTSEEVLGQAPNQSFTLPVELAADPWNLIAFGAANKVTGAARMGKLFSAKTLGAAEAVAGGSANVIDKGADVFTKAVQKMSFGLLKRDTQRAIAKSAAYGGGAAAIGTMLTNAPSEARNAALTLMSLYPMYKMGSGVLRRVEGAAGTGKLIMREAADATNGLDDVARAAVASNPRVPQQIREVLANPSRFTPIESTPARIAKSEAFSPRVREVAARLANPLVVQASRAAGATARGAAVGTVLNIPFAEAYREMGDERTADSVYAGGLLFGAAGGLTSRVAGAKARRRDAAVSDIGRMLVDIQKTNAGEDIGAPGVNRAYELYYSMAEPGRMLTDVELAGGDIDALLRNTKFEDLAGMAAMQGFYRDTVDFVPLNAFDYEANVKALGGTGTAGYFLHAPEGQRARLFLNADARRTDVAPHEYGHALLQSAATSPEMKNSARAFINQRYGPERLDAMAREYATQLIKNRNAKAFPNEKLDVSEGEIDSMIYELGEAGLGRGDADRLDWLRDEIFAEEHRAAGIDYAQIRRNIPDGFSVVGFAENVLGANARALGVAGVPIDPQTGALRTPPDRLFKDNPLLAADAVMRRNVQQYVRAYKQWLNDPAHEVATGAPVSRTGNPNELKNNPNVTFRDYGNGRLENELAFIDENGNVKVKDKKNDPERAKFIRARQQQVREMIDRGTKEPSDPTFGARVRDGQRIVAGKKLPPRFDMTRFPGPLKELARRMEALAEAGETMQVRYFALGKSKDVFKQGDIRGVQAINREVMFVEWQATKDGNINAFVVDLTQFRNRAMKAIADRDPSLSEINWDFKQLEADLRRVLDNHANGRAGADGIGDKRRNAVNALLGIGTKTNRLANPLTGLGGKGSALKTLRLDAFDEVAGTGRQGFEFDYQKANGNFMPDKPAPRPDMDSDLELPNRMPSALPQAGMAMPDAPANLSTDQILRELEENQGYLGLSTLGMREGRPVRGGAQQTRELLKRNTALNEELRRRGGPQEESDVERVLRQRGQAMPDVADAVNDASSRLGGKQPRMTTQTAWMTPDGNFLNVGAHGHSAILEGQKQQLSTVDYMRMGFVRLNARESGKLYADARAPLTQSQLSELKNTAIERGLELIIEQPAANRAQGQAMPDTGDYTNDRLRKLSDDYNGGDRNMTDQDVVEQMRFIIEDAPAGYFPKSLSDNIDKALRDIDEQYREWGGRDDLRSVERAVEQTMRFIEKPRKATGGTRGQAMPEVAPTLENFDAAQQATGGTLRPIADQPENAPIAGRLTPEQSASINELQEYYRSVTPQRIKELQADAVESLASRLINKGIPVTEANDMAKATFRTLRSRVNGAMQVISGMGTSDLSRMAGTGRPAVATRKGVNPNWLTSAFEAFDTDNDLALMKAQQVARQLNKEQQAQVAAGQSVDAARASGVRSATIDQGMQFVIGEKTADQKAFGSSLREDPSAPPRVYASVVEGQKFGSQGNYNVFFEWKKDAPMVVTSHHHYGVGNGLTDIHASANIGDKNARSFGDPQTEVYDTLPSGKKVLRTRLLVGNAGAADIRAHQLMVSIPESALSGIKKKGAAGARAELNRIAISQLVGSASQGKTQSFTSKDGVAPMVAIQRNRTEAYVLNPDLKNVASITIVSNSPKETALIKKNLASAFKNNGSPLPRIKVVSAESGPSGNPGRKKITDEFFNLTGKVVYGAALGGAAALAADESQQ